MPKTQMICPDQMRRSGCVEFKPIPVNQYNKTVADELPRFTRKDLLRIQRDMEIIRAFENMLNEVKLRGKYKGIEYNHRGPAHLSIGQEAARRRPGLPAGRRRPHLRQPPQPRRDPRQGPLGHPEARRRTP